MTYDASDIAAALKVKGVAASVGGRGILVIHGQRSFETSGARRLVTGALRGSDWHTRAVSTSPLTVEAMLEAFRALRNLELTVVVAVGGGSILDAGKILAGCRFSEDRFRVALEGQLVPRASRVHRLWLMPTTSGSGAESTPFATVFDSGIKKSVEGDGLMADGIIRATSVVASQPWELAVIGALDTLTQGVESCWSTGANQRSRLCATEAISGVWTQLGRLAQRHQPEWTALVLAGARSGEAIAVSRTTACHAISYPLTSRFGVPHGHAAVLTLPAMMRRIDRVYGDGAHAFDQVVGAIGSRTLADSATRIESLLDRLGIERRLSRLGCVSDDDRTLVATEAVTSARMARFPLPMDVKEVTRVLLNLG